MTEEHGLEERVKQIEKTLWIGNGVPALVVQISDISTMLKTREQERRRVESRQNAKLNLLLTFMGLVLVPLLIALVIRR